MSVDLTKLQFDSSEAVDKIAVYSTSTDASTGALPHYKATIPAAVSPPNSTIYTGTVSNPYGKRGLLTISWSLDTTNWYPENVPIYYFNTANNVYAWRMLVFGGCSDSTIYFGFNTQSDTSTLVYLQFAMDIPS